MSEQNQPTNEPENKENQQQKDIMIPKSRFDEVNIRMKEAETKLNDFLAQQKQQEEADSAKRGEFEKLYNQSNEQLNTYKSQAEELQGVVQQLLDNKLASVPEQFRDLIPEGTISSKLGWIANAEAKGLFGAVKGTQPIGNSTNPSSTNEKLTKRAELEQLYSESTGAMKIMYKRELDSL